MYGRPATTVTAELLPLNAFLALFTHASTFTAFVFVFKYAIIMLIIGQCSTLHCCFCVILCFIMLLLLL